jgi:general secretion pathway protein D
MTRRPTPASVIRTLSLCGLALAALTACASHPTSPRVAPQPGSAASAPQTPAGETPGQTQTSRSRPPVVVQGTGTLVAPPENASAAAPSAAGNGFELNFIDTEISAVVSAVLGDGLNRPYVVDPQVKGKITLQASRALSRDEVLSALESALRTQGAALIDVDGVYHVVPAKDAPRHISSLQLARQSAHGYGIYVVPLQYVGAADMEKVLQPFAPEGGIIKVDEARNLLVLAGTSQEMATLLNVVKTFDVDWLAGMSFALYPLDYVDAKTLAGELQEVFSAGKSPLAGVVRFVPLSRLNSLMVVTPQAKYLQDVATWIKRLDLGSSTPGRRIYVYEVQNGKAEDLARTLDHILSLRDDTARGGGLGGAAGRGSTLGSATSYGATSQFGASMPFGSPSAGVPPIMPSAAAPAPFAASGGGGSALEQGELEIVPDTNNNSLLILASPSEFTVIEAALKRLDVLPIQVLIEASVAEVTLTDELKYGLQWAYQGKNGTLTFSEAPNGAISQQFPGFSYLYTGKVNIPAVLNALESLTSVKILSSPKLLVLNNHEAVLEVGDEVPIATQSAVSTTAGGAPIVNSLQLQQTGVILHITPRANKSGKVIIDVSQEVSSVVPTTTSSLPSPTIQERRLTSTVSVQDGETIALGGMIQEQRSRSNDGVPFLSKIPIIGELFGSTDRQTTRSELVVLLTPHVIRSEEDSAAAMADFEQEFRALHKSMPGLLGTPASDRPRSGAPSTPDNPHGSQQERPAGTAGPNP